MTRSTVLGYCHGFRDGVDRVGRYVPGEEFDKRTETPADCNPVDYSVGYMRGYVKSATNTAVYVPLR